MKSFIFKNIILLFGIVVAGVFFNSCNSDDNEKFALSNVKITKVFLEDADANVIDREVTFARQGQLIRLEGNGFSGIKKVYVNGYDCYFNPVFVTNTSMLVRINKDTPVFDASDDVRNTIRLTGDDVQFYTYTFVIRAAAPSITNVSHTMPAVGDVIVITGKGLQEVTKVEFPGGVQATEFSSNEEGTEVVVTVPEGISPNGGSILIICANGGAYSPANFNYKVGLVHNFDDVQNYSWGSEIDNTAQTDLVPASGIFPKSQGGYQIFNATGDTKAGSVQKFWLNSTAIFSTITNYIPASTAAADCGIQMDIYVEGAWNSGVIRFVMADGSGNDRYCMLYQPVYVNGAYNIAAFENPGCWFTITLPFSLSADYDGKTLADVVASMSSASYKQAGPFFENSGIKDVFDAVPATEKIYFDNIRFVPLTTPAYSDFPDE
jgi:hypothetical protein